MILARVCHIGVKGTGPMEEVQRRNRNGGFHRQLRQEQPFSFRETRTSASAGSATPRKRKSEETGGLHSLPSLCSFDSGFDRQHLASGDFYTHICNHVQCCEPFRCAFKSVCSHTGTQFLGVCSHTCANMHQADDVAVVINTIDDFYLL